MKSLLLGSAVAMVAATGAAQAADTVVMAAAPEPVEYVRVCDVYGAGFYYIPGTETCLKFSGTFRYQINGLAAGAGYTKFTRFQLNTDVRSETALGTLRGYAEVRAEFTYGTIPGIVAGVVVPVTGYYTTTYINQMFIELQRAGGTLRLGLSDTPYARFLGYGGPTINDGAYGFNNAPELSYTFHGGSGFSAIVALIEDKADTDWMPDIEAGVNFSQGWGSIGAIVGYDESASTWGAKAVGRFNITSMIGASLHVFYSSGAGTYAILDPAGALTTWSVLGGLSAKFTPTITGNLTAQWFDTSTWAASVNVNLHPVQNLEFIPEISYASPAGGTWTWRIRVNRNF